MKFFNSLKKRNEIDSTKMTFFYIMIGCILIASCNSPNRATKDFNWSDDIATLTGKDLQKWLRQAPFENELKKQQEDKIVFSNAQQVFPFMARYYDAVEELANYELKDTIIYQQQEVLFQDSIWGDLFLSATLLYDQRELFLGESYFETGSPFFGGADAVTDIHSASLYETAVFATHPSYKTGIYWVQSNFMNYLLGFYQSGQLVFETLIPVLRGDTLATLNKLKEINKDLNLHISEWESAHIALLKRVNEPKSFWQDPFAGIYPDSHLLTQVNFKTKDTSFEQAEIPPKGDHYFSYQSGKGLVEFYTVLQETALSKQDFDKANRKMNTYRFRYQDIFYEENASKGSVNGIAKAYFKDKQYLAVHYRYPESDGEAKTQVHDILKHIKIYAQ